MEGNKARTGSLYDGEAKEVAHVKHMSELLSKVRAPGLEVKKTLGAHSGLQFAVATNKD